MREKNRYLPRMFWIFSLWLAWLPLSARVGEIKSFFQYAAILAHRSNSEVSARLCVSRLASFAADRIRKPLRDSRLSFNAGLSFAVS
jgi:hypothetical protein